MSAASISARASSFRAWHGSVPRPSFQRKLESKLAWSGSNGSLDPAFAGVTGRRHGASAPASTFGSRQSLVMTPQLQQAIRLLALSNLEIESFIAEELEKNPLLDTGGGERGAGDAEREPEPDRARRGGRRRGRRHVGPAAATSAARHRPRQRESPPGQRRRPCAARRRPRPRWQGIGRRRRSGEGPDFDSFAERRRLAPRPSPRPGRRDACRAPTWSSPSQIIEQIDETGYFLASLLDIAQRLGVAARRGRARARHRPDLRSGRRRRPQPRRMPRAPGEGRRPLRSGDGAADRQSRLSRQGQSRAR